MGASSFPIDLVLLGMIAAFLVLRLRSVLGKRTGFERGQTPVARAAQSDGRIIDVRPEPVASKAGASARVVPERASELGACLERMRGIDPQFSPARFLDGAEAAFRMIVVAYAKGDRATLKPLLGADIWTAFEAGIAAREAARETQLTTLHSIASATIETAALEGSRASIGVRFVSDQVSYTNNETGVTVVGTEALTEITDHWSFERDLSARDPAWRLLAAHSG